MEEELLKRNTDCVYFLASPLTCKKGIECEYRHSEIARLNPRDCWYWLSGSCLNPSCGFRHPPLDVPAEAPSEFAPLPYQSSVPVEKTNVPCYFYFNGFCNKGDRCSFLHGPDGTAPAAKSLKSASASTEAPPSMENKTSAGSEKGSGPTETPLKPPNLSETITKAEVEIGFQAKEEVQQLPPKTVLKQSTSPQISVFESEEEALVRPDSLLPAEGSIQNLLLDQSSEEQADEDDIEPEERWESSPGFDVLVDDKSENLGYDDDQDYLPSHDRDQQDLNNHFMGYDYEDLDEYNHTYPDAAELLYDREMYDCYDHLENEHIFDNVRRIPGHSRERMLDSLLPRKRKPLPMELAINNNHNDLDLRDHLLKRRVIDGPPVTRSSRRHDSSCLIGRGPERPRRQGMDRHFHGRLTSEISKNTIDSFRDYGKVKLSQSQQNRSRQRTYRERRPSKRELLSSEVSRKSVSRERRSAHESATFTGPKTLAQLKEEKRKVEGNEYCFMKMRHSNRTSSANFQGPKPLSEILQEKKKLGCVKDGNGDSD